MSDPVSVELESGCGCYHGRPRGHSTCIAVARLAERYEIYMSYTVRSVLHHRHHGSLDRAHSNCLPKLGTNCVGNKKQFFGLCWYYREIRCDDYVMLSLH